MKIYTFFCKFTKKYQSIFINLVEATNMLRDSVCLLELYGVFFVAEVR